MKEKWKILWRPFLIIFLIYLVGISAILLAGVHYADDAARTNYGYAGWSAFSRYISTALSYFIHADGYLTNIAPLPQILAAGILAVSSVMLVLAVSGVEVFKEKWTKWIWRIVAVVPLGLCPYMLECLSYQYDAVYMALSVFFAVMPFMFWRKGQGKFVVSSIIGILGVCMTYQAAIGIYPMMVVFLMMKEWSAHEIPGKEIFKKIVVTATVFLLTLVFFQKILMRTQDIYVSNEIPGISEFFPSLFAHLGHYFELLLTDFRVIWKVLIGVMMAMSVILYAMRSKRNKGLSVVVGIVGLSLMFVSMYALYAALEKPLYTTRAMYAVGALIAIMGVYIVDRGAEFAMSVKVYEWVLAIPVVMICWCFFAFSFTYGNALAEQGKFRDRQIDMVIADLNKIMVSDPVMADAEVRTIRATGQIGFAPAIEHMPELKYHIVRRLLKPSFETNVNWMAYRLTEASGLKRLKFDPYTTFTNEGMQVLKETVLYTIYGDKTRILVQFKGEEFGVWE